MRLILLASTGSVVALLAAACASSFPAVLPQATDIALVEQWPLTVGLVVAPGAEKMRAQPGPDAGAQLAPTIRWALQRRFHAVSNEASSRAGTFRVVASRSSSARAGIETTRVEVDVELHDAAGALVDRWTVHGEAMSARIVDASLGLDDTLALRDASAVLIVDLPRRPAVRAWLARNGVATPADGPMLPAVPSAAAEVTGVALLPLAPPAERARLAVRAQDCLGARLQPAIRVVDDEAVRGQLFPWFEPSTRPADAQGLLDFLGEPALRASMDAIGVRYVVLFAGGTTMQSKGGGILCGNGCFGFEWGNRTSAFTAIVLDARQGVMAGDRQAQRSGGVYMPAFILPIPLIAPTESQACDALAEDVRRVIGDSAAR